MQPEVKTDPVLATAGSAIATEQKDIEAHFYFPCASISFLSVLRSCFRPRPIALEFSSQHYTATALGL